MKVVITGGFGFLGQRLARALLERGALTGPSGEAEKIDEILLFDMAVPDSMPAGLEDERVAMAAGDISDKATVTGLVDRDDISVFHLASIVSAGGEKDFDLALRVNLEGNLHVLEALRALQGLPRLVFTSSIAVFGGEAMTATGGDGVSDMTKQTPRTTYGVTKSIGELLINDYSRKGFLDGRTARLPTVIIRPGKPNAAASSFLSGVFREPLNGIDMALPVRPETQTPVLGYRAIIEGLVHLHELPGTALGHDRAAALPALNVTVEEMIAALQRVAGDRLLGEISVVPDPAIEAIVGSWPKAFDNTRAQALGFPAERSLDEIVAYYIADYLDA